MSTRTSIRIGTVVEEAMKQKMPGFTKVTEEYTSQYLLFGYTKPVLGHYHSWVLFQASREFGAITCEVGVSRTQEYPYYRFLDSPRLGVSGFRARTRHVLQNLEARTTRAYNGPDTLTSLILELTTEAVSASQRLLEIAVPRLAEEYALWQPFYTEWQQAEALANDIPDRRYPGLVGEAVARRILHATLSSGQYDSYLGAKKFRYREPDFLNCHVYLLAKALAFVDPPERHEIALLKLDPGQDPDKILYDPIASLTGRTEQDEAVVLPAGILQRAPDWAFLRSFAALEAFFEKPMVALEEVKTSIHEPSPVVAEVAPVGLSLDELYGESPSAVEELQAPELAPLALEESAVSLGTPLYAETTVSSGLSSARPDPFELILPYLNGEAADKTATEDPFDLLGAQLGL